MKNIVKNTIILFVITLVVGVLLAFAYEITKEPRAYQEELSAQKANLAVFPDAASFKACDYDEDELNAAVAAANEAVGLDGGIAAVINVQEAYDSSDNLLGYVFTVDSYKGYGGTIEFTVGIQSDGTVNGYSILSIDETAGLGMHAKDADWAAQFAGKKVDAFAWTKNGATAENEIDAITGATYTTKAMTYGVNAALYAFQYLTGGAQ